MSAARARCAQVKPWYYEQAPRPGTSVIGARLTELATPVIAHAGRAALA